MKNNILEIKDLSIGHRDSEGTILDNISFTVEKQKITGIVGESGSGKSITALGIMGLLPPSLAVKHGQIIFQSHDGPINLNLLPSEKMNGLRGKEIAMIFQEPMTSLNPSMKCGLQATEPLIYHSGLPGKEAREKVLDLFRLSGLPEPERIFFSYPHQLSGGQRQRVMIAMALSTNPSLLIADEPTTALDVSVQKNIVTLLKKLQREFSLSILFITHDLRLLGEIADSIVVMRSGEVIESGTKPDIFLHPSAPYTRGLLACQPPLDHRPERLLTITDMEIENISPGNTRPPAETKSRENSPKSGLLEIKSLSVSYKRNQGVFSGAGKYFHALNHINLTIYKGETLGLVGESGCGKTTLGKAILRLIDTHSGNIIYKGKNIATMNRKESRIFRKNVQVVFQDPFSSLNPRLKIEYVLSEARKLHFPGEDQKIRREKVTNLLLSAGLNHTDLQKFPHQFSGGQRQRIGIVRALVTEPELLVLDESVSALDVSVQAQIVNLLNDLKTEFDLSYLFISHDLAVVNYVSDRIIVMKDGNFIEEGKPYEMFRDPASDYTRKLIEAIPGYQNSSRPS